MDKEEEDKPKKEIGCLFYNFNIKKNPTPLSAEITKRNKKIKKMCHDMNADTENFMDKYLNLKYYKLYLKYYSPKLISLKKVTNRNNNRRSLHSKIYFGNFFNQNSEFDGMNNMKKYEQIKKMISKSSNFAFIKDPKSFKFPNIPKSLYLPQEDSFKFKNLFTDHNNNIKINIEDEEDNLELNEELKRKIYKLKYNNSFFKDDKQKKNKKNISLLKKISSKSNSSNSVFYPVNQNNSTEFKRSSRNINFIDNKNSSPNIMKSKNLDKKNKSHSNIYKINISSKLEKNNNSYSNLFNQTDTQNNYLSHKNILYSKIIEKLDKITKYKTPKNKIKKLSNLSKVKCKNKIKKISKLIKNNSEIKWDIKYDLELRKLLRENKNKKKQKRLRNQFYYDMKNRIRLLSIVDKLKSMDNNAPINLIKHLNQDYYEKSKEIIVHDKVAKKFNNIYRSSTEGKIIKEKFSDKSHFIKKFISKNQIDGLKLKNRYAKCDMLIDEIVEENDANNYKMLAWINKTKQIKQSQE